MAACCCLCRNHVVDAKRKKRLHGAGCTTAKAVLREVLCVSLEALVETRNATAVLCCKCEKILNSIDSLSVKIESLTLWGRNSARMRNVHVMRNVYYRLTHVTHTT